MDPLAGKYPHNSVYAFSENRVVDGVELEGLEVMLTKFDPGYKGTSWPTIQLSVKISVGAKASLKVDVGGAKIGGALNFASQDVLKVVLSSDIDQSKISSELYEWVNEGKFSYHKGAKFNI
ncbi:MAG: hypothetical protein H6581_10820 [Bacteroidia bacterium]|nr:hypothetical protein [Bacteroidia bacterium]